ncbi:MAG: pilus assembly protein PilP [bacterium]
MKKPVFIFTFALLFSLCSYQASSFAKTAEKKTAKKPQITYPYFLKRNPFQTFLYTPKHISSFKAGELPLLQYSISSLKVVGIMERRGKYFAMIQTPGNRSYIITTGSLVGINRARVVSINGNAVNLVERTYNILGQMQSLNVVMGLK